MLVELGQVTHVCSCCLIISDNCLALLIHHKKNKQRKNKLLKSRKMFTCPQLKNKKQTYLSLCMIVLQVLAPNELVLRTLFYVLMDSQGSE